MRNALLPPALSDDPEIHAAVLHERESCAFLAEGHSGSWDLATIEQVAQSIRARGEDSREECVHLIPDRYGALLAAESELRALKAKAAPKDMRESIRQALADAAVRDFSPRIFNQSPDEIRADAVMAVLTDLGVIPGEGGRHG